MVGGHGQLTSVEPIEGSLGGGEARRFDEAVREPIFVLCAARTGSTLLRKLVDAHPDLYSPPETNFAQSVAAICQLFEVLSGPASSVTQEARAACYQLADSTLATKTRLHGKRRWCDKSLSTVGVASLMRDVFPQARFICLYRDCFDFLASAMESSPWGYGAYGFEPYVRDTPSNFLVGLGRYWADRVQAQLDFENEHSSVCLRLRYEDLVAEPESVLQAVWSFIGVPASDETTDGAWGNDDAHPSGPGDHKIMWTHAITGASVGRGWTVPLTLIPQPLKERIDALQAQLDYQADPHLRYHGSAVDRVDRAPELSATVRASLQARFPNPISTEITPTARLCLPSFGETWLLDLSGRGISDLSGYDTSDTLPTIFAVPEALLLIMLGAINPATAMRSGQLQAMPPSSDTSYDADQLEALMRQFIEVVGTGRDQAGLGTFDQPKEMVS